MKLNKAPGMEAAWAAAAAIVFSAQTGMLIYSVIAALCLTFQDNIL